MATKLFLKSPLSSFNNAYGYANPTQSVLAKVTSVTNTVSGGTSIQATKTAGGSALKWISSPLTSGLTISGTVTFNVWALESALTANSTVSVSLFRYTAGAELGTAFASAAFGSELTTSIAVNNWTVAPTSTTFIAGDRIVAYINITPAGGTMGSAKTVTVDYGGPTAAADGDTWFQFTEALTFDSEGEFIQDASASASAVALPAASATGNTVVGFVVWSGTVITINGITDNKGNAYNLIGSPTVWDASGRSFQAYYATNVTGGSILTATITWTGGTPTSIFNRFAEYAGIAASGFDVGGGGASGNSGTATSGSITTNFANELIVAFQDEINSNAVTPSGGFVVRGTTSGWAFLDKVVNATGSYSCTCTFTSDFWVISIAGFKAGTQPAQSVFPPLLGDYLMLPRPHLLVRL